MVHSSAVAALALLPAAVLGKFEFPKINVKLVQGQSTATTSYSTETQVSCSTVMAPFPPFFPVVTRTFTSLVPDLFPTTVTSTSEPVITVTPNPISIIKTLTTVVSTVVDGPPVTQITKITDTILTSIVSTIIPPLATVTLTIVDTSTSYTSTSTIASSAGFKGVLQTGLPALTRRKRDELLDMRIRSEEIASREVVKRSWIGNLFGGIFGGNHNPPSGPPSGPGSSPNPWLHGLPWLPNPGNMISWHDNLYPIGVNCLAKIIAHKIITVVVVCSPTTTTVKGITVIATRTDTKTVTSTRIPSTVTIPTTISTTQTNTVTVTGQQNTFIATTTTTAILEQVSSYFAACGSQNLLGPTLPSLFGVVAGDVITDVLYDGSIQQLVTTDGNTAYDCCQQCIETTGCTFGGWMPAGLCYLHVTKDKTCPAQSSNIGEYVVAAPPQEQTFGVYNGYCGSLGYGGLDSNL